MASAPSKPNIEATTATKLIRAITDDSRSSSTSVEYCDFIEIEAEEDSQPLVVVTQQMASERVARQAVAFEFSSALLKELEKVLKRLSKNVVKLGYAVSVLNDLIAQASNLYVRGLVNGMVFSTNCHRLANTRPIQFLIIRLDAHI